MKAALVVVLWGCLGLTGCVIYLNPQCTDQIKNGDETGVDCGGKCGQRCEIGQGCRSDGDCDGSRCVGNVCTPLACDNGVQDEQETDVDCGGPTCRQCSGGRHCQAATDCFSANCAAGGVCSSLGTLAFADPVTYPREGKPYAIFSADMNADTRIDLVVANEIGNSISVYLNNGSGAFQPLATAFPTGVNDFPTGGTVADFNGDGKLDVITANFHGYSVGVLLGTGGGALGPDVGYPTNVDRAETSNLAVGDLNNDKIPDVIATNQSGSSVSEFLGNGDGTFGPATTLPVGISSASMPFSAAIGDFNGDGNADVAIAENVSATAIVRLGNGDGTFQAETPYELDGIRDFVVITADLNLDGNLDLVSANRGSHTVSVLLGRGDGTFRKAIVSRTTPSTASNPQPPGLGPYSLAVADFNRDGVLDVITANFMSGDATILLGIGNGHFEAPFNAGTTATISYGVAVGDFNGDNKTDFATANATANSVTVKLNTSN